MHGKSVLGQHKGRNPPKLLSIPHSGPSCTQSSMSSHPFDDIDYTTIPIEHLILDTEAENQAGPDTSSSFELELASLTTRVEQYHWIVSWLEKHRLFKTLDTLLEEGAEIASESFGLSKVGEGAHCDEDYAKAQLHSYDLHTGQNVLAVRFHPDPTLEVIATGSTDRTAVISNWKTGEKLTTIYGAHTAPVLCLDWNPKVEGRLVMGSVDNSASVVEIKSLRGEKEPLSYEVLARLPIHKKHVVRVAWSPNGKRFATASYDHFVKVLDEKVNEDGEVKYEVIKEIEFAEAVESIVWTPDEKWLIVSARLDNYLHYYDTENWKETKFNMNVAQHDDHVSFTAMDLELSPDGKHLLVSTDKNRMIMFATGTPLQERNFYDVPNGEWCTPRASFNHTGTFVYVSSEDKSIYIYDVATATKRHVLSGHTSNVRDLSCHPCYDIIATASFDKSVKIWQ